MDSKVTLACLIFSVTIAVIGLVLSAVAFNKSSSTVTVGGGNPNGGGNTGGQTGGTSGNINVQVTPNAQPKRKIFTIAHGHDWHAHEYIDAGGRVQGFSLDMISAVCKAADIKCETIWEPYTNCWNSIAGQHSRTGKGLISKWYDGCIGWAQSIPRGHSVGFTNAYLGKKPAFLYKRTNDPNFNWSDLTGKKIGFMDGWVDDEKCLARQTGITGNVLAANMIKHYETQQELVKGLITGEVGAAYGGTEIQNILTTAQQSQVTKGTVSYYCMYGGNSVMTRKDSQEFIDAWNKGFQIIKQSGKFKQMCDSVNDKNSQPVAIDCVP